MIKYSLIFNNCDTNENQKISLKSKNEYEDAMEICFIDRFTSQFIDEMSCIEYLFSKKIISSENGYLSICKPNGLKQATGIIYDDGNFKNFAKEICDKKNAGFNVVRLDETILQKQVRSQIINFFNDDKEALNSFVKTFFEGKNFSKLLKEYIDLNVPKGWIEPGEYTRINSIRMSIYSMLRNYELLREIYLWIRDYQLYQYKQKFSGYQSDSNVKNPYEEYEKRNNL